MKKRSLLSPLQYFAMSRMIEEESRHRFLIGMVYGFIIGLVGSLLGFLVVRLL